MAGFITFDKTDPERTWSSANWVFNGVLDHVLSTHADDAECVERLTGCKYRQNVPMKYIEEENGGLFDRVVSYFLEACDHAANGEFKVSVNGETLDEESQTQFREAISDLRQLLNAELANRDN